MCEPAFTYSEHLASVKNRRESLLLSKVTSSLNKEGNQVQRTFYREKSKVNAFLQKLGKNSGKLEDLGNGRYSFSVVELHGSARARSSLEGPTYEVATDSQVTTRPRTASVFMKRPTFDEVDRLTKKDLPGLNRRRMSDSFLGAERRPMLCWMASEMEKAKDGGTDGRVDKAEHERDDDYSDGDEQFALKSSKAQASSNRETTLVRGKAVPRIRSRTSGICFCRRHCPVSESIQASNQERVASKFSMVNFPVSSYSAPRTRDRKFSLPLVTRFCSEAPAMTTKKERQPSSLRRKSSHDIMRGDGF